MSNPACTYAARHCVTLPTYRTRLRDFVAAFRRWLARVAPAQVRQWPAARITAELTKLRIQTTYEDGCTYLIGIRPT
jgi:hypothetical protein